MNATLPAVVAPTRAAAPTAAHRHVELMQGFALRVLANRTASLSLIARSGDPEIWRDLSAMQNAILKGLMKIGEAWQEGLFELGRQAAQIREANTLTKLVEQETNLPAQYASLASRQAAALAGLMESAQVGYAYWLNQKLE